MTISKELADKVLRADLNNIKAKVKGGKTLTASERAIISRHAGGSSPVSEPRGSDSPGGSNTGSRRGEKVNVTKLAYLLGVSRQTVYNWRKDPESPQPDGDGNYPLELWLEFVKNKGRDNGSNLTETQLKNRRLLAQCKKLEAELLILQGRWIPRPVVSRYMEDVFVSCRSRVMASTMDDMSKEEILNELTRLQSADRVVARTQEIGRELQGLETSSEDDGIGVVGEEPEVIE